MLMTFWQIGNWVDCSGTTLPPISQMQNEAGFLEVRIIKINVFPVYQATA